MPSKAPAAAVMALEHLVKEFPGVRALDGVSLEARAGEIHALCGENGAGKSTLLKVLAGVHVHGSYGGRLLLDGSEARFLSPRDAEAKGIVLVAQELNLVPALSLAENLFLGRERKLGWRVDWGRTLDEARQALGRVGLDVDPRTPSEALSIGQRQLVEIAKALHQQARVLILDEPTAALTEADALRLEGLVRDIAAQGTAVLYVSHRLDEVFRLADYITVLRDGRSVASRPGSEWDRDQVVAAMVGRELLAADHIAPPVVTGSLALELRNWSLHWPGIPGKLALDNLNLGLRQGEILGLAGLMGSGRTALLSTLFGSWKAAGDGELKLANGSWRPAFRSPQQAMSEGVCLASEDRKRQGLVSCASVLENLELASFTRLSSYGRVLWPQARAEAEIQRQAMRVKTPTLDVEVNTLSGGNQQKVVLGRLLQLGPKVLLLDEPTRGIDVGAKAEIHQLIRALAAKGLAVLLASSDLPELLALSHRVAVLSQGRLAGELEREKFSPEAVMQLATRF